MDQQIPTVVGPDSPERFYITDKHHLAYALFSASFGRFKTQIRHRVMYVCLLSARAPPPPPPPLCFLREIQDADPFFGIPLLLLCAIGASDTGLGRSKRLRECIFDSLPSPKALSLPPSVIYTLTRKRTRNLFPLHSYACIDSDYRHLSKDDFFNVLKARNDVYLKDEMGRDIDVCMGDLVVQASSQRIPFALRVFKLSHIEFWGHCSP